MPLELSHSSQNNQSLILSNIYDDLRIDLIGNKDLKYKLIGDSKFISSFTTEFIQLVEAILTNKNEQQEQTLLKELEKQLVILNLLCSFIADLKLQNDSLIQCLFNLETILNPIIQLFGHLVTKLQQSSSFGIETLMYYCINLLLNLLSVKHCSIQTSKLITFIIDIVTKSEMEFHIQPMIIIESLKLIPILLKSYYKASYEENIYQFKALLLALIHRGSNICKSIMKQHNLEVHEELEIPNIQLIGTILESEVIDFKLLRHLNIGISQILNFMTGEEKLNLTFTLKNCMTTFTSIHICPEYFISLFLLLNHHNQNNSGLFKISCLNLLNHFIKEEVSLSENFRSETYQYLILPKIIESIRDNDQKYNSSVPYIMNPTSILADLCGHYPSLIDEIYNCNIDAIIFKSLEQHMSSNKFLNGLIKLKHKRCDKTLVDFTKLNTEFDSEIPNLLLLLSVFTNESEEYRNRIISKNGDNSLSKIIFELIDCYYFALEQVRIGYKLINLNKVKNFKWFNLNLSIILTIIDNELFTNCFYFVRSISRSVATLRTFFVECNSFPSYKNQQVENPNVTGGANSISQSIPTTTYSTHVSSNETNLIPSGPLQDQISGNGFINDILGIITNYENLTRWLLFFYKPNYTDQFHKSMKIQMTNQIVIIGVLANFILDFSSFRYKILGYESFLSILSSIYASNSTDEEDLVDRSLCTEEEQYQKNTIQLKILQFVKNLLYNEASDFKLDIMEFNFPLVFVLKKASFGLLNDETLTSEIGQLKMQQKIVSFEILKNFTAGSPYHNEVINREYQEKLYPIYNDSGSERDGESDGLKLPSNWCGFIIENITKVKLYIPSHTYVRYNDTDFFNDTTLLKLISVQNYVKLITSINYIEDHKFTQIKTIPKSMFPSDELLTIWKKLLSSNYDNHENQPEYDAKINNNLNQIKISIVWIIINLSWNVNYQMNRNEEEDDDDYSHYEVYQTVRHRQLKHDLISDEADEEENEEAKLNFNYTLDLNKSELDVYDRIKILDSFGFTKLIRRLMRRYKKESMMNNSNKFEVQNSHALYEKLQTAFNQLINGLRTPKDRKASTKTDKQLDPVNNPLLTHTNDTDDELKYERSNRRDAIDSEDNDDEFEEDAQEEIDDIEDIDQDEDDDMVDEEDNETNEGNEDDTDDSDGVPTEYWVM